MLSSLAVISIFCLYMGLLFVLALWTQRGSAVGRNIVNNPLIYSLSLAVYCSSWTFYGSVGLAANTGFLFLTIYLGPTIMIVFWGGLLRKMVRLKSSHRITSIADFISARYEKSETLAALATLVALVGTVPYVSLQLKAILDSFAIITSHQGEVDSWIGNHVGVIVVGLMILFTIIFGVRRLEPTERHEGMVMAVAAESIVKLVSLVAAGIFVCYWIFGGVTDIFDRIMSNPFLAEITLKQAREVSLLTWLSYMLLSANAVIFLPRQFHIAVVENQSENHVKWAMCLFPLYLFALNLFIYPTALGGLLKGYPFNQADTFLLRLPLDAGNPYLALFVFIGGFSAATSMILISSMTMSTMISNHLLLPLVHYVPRMAFFERRLLACRWISVAAFILSGYWFQQKVGHHFRLADIGMLSFGAILQLAPAVLGGLFWRGGNRRGAYLGLWAGFIVWFYTLLLPAFVKSGWITNDILTKGPFGWWFLKPEQLFGFAGMDRVPHCVFWSMFFNLGIYILGSLWAETGEEGQSQAEAFVGARGETTVFPVKPSRKAYIFLDDKRLKIMELFSRYFGTDKAEMLVEKSIREVGFEGKKLATINELATLYNHVEKSLGASIGSATANRALARAEFFTPTEAEDLREMYAEILADLRAKPEDLKRQIDFHLEREALVEKHAEELEEKVNALEDQILRRKEAEARLRESEERYRLAIESSYDGVVVIQQGGINWCNRRFPEIFGYRNRSQVIGMSIAEIIHPEDRNEVLEINNRRQSGRPAPSRFDFKGIKKDGTPIYIAVSATTINYHGDTLLMAYLRDVTSRRMAEEEIRNLSRRLIEGIEEERRRLAADLHDEFGQALTGLHLGVESLKDSLAADSEKLKGDCDKLIKMIERLAENLRNISSELRPDMLDHLGLVPTVEWYIQDFKMRMPGMKVEFQAVGFRNRKLNPQTEIVLYRILQEALNNIAKHASAGLIVVQLTYSHPTVIMVISDDGRGFDMKKDLSASGMAKTGIGLVSMKERAASAGGTIDIRSHKGRGTMIRISLPAA